MDNKIIDLNENDLDLVDTNEKQLRPSSLAGMIGRGKERHALEIMIQAAKKRKEVLDHILFSGPPGLGKTSFSYVVAKEMNMPLIVTSGPAIERQGDLVSILSNIENGAIFFIDEIHRLNRSIEEILYPAMDERALDIVIGKGPSAKTLRLDLPPFTIIGATTKLGMLSSPLRDRFGAHYQLDFYNKDDLAEILKQKAKVLEVGLEQEGAAEIARRSRGTPRIALRLLKRVRDYVQVKGYDRIDKKMANEALKIHEIDEAGLTSLDRKILSILLDLYEGNPVGLATLAASLSEDLATIEDFHEPFLMQAGFIKRTERGRVITEKGKKHMLKYS